MASRENRLHLYKRRVPEQDVRRKKLADERRKKRDTARSEAFAALRGIPEEPVVTSRQQKLEEWKKRRQVAPKSVMNGDDKKPAFVFTKITYNDTHLYKPFESSTFRAPKGVVPVQSAQPDRQLRSKTRNQQKGPPQTVGDALSAFATAMTKTKPKKILKATNLQIPAAKTKSVDILNRAFDGMPTPKQDAVPTEDTIQFSLINCTKIEMVPNVFENPSQTSSPISQPIHQGTIECMPVVTANKKVQFRKSSRKSLIGEGVLEDSPAIHLPEMTEKDISIGNLEQPGEKKSADYFRSLHSDAVEKLNSLCSKWTNKKSQDLPDSINDDIDVAVGHAHLLISQRLQQFLDLIVEHEDTNSSSELKVLSSDLDGFWGMVDTLLQNIYTKFDKLETSSLNNWQDSSTNIRPVKGHAQNNSKKSKIRSKGHASSGLRSFLAQARKQAQTGAGENSNANTLLNSSLMKSSPIVMRVTERAKQLGSPRTPKQTVSAPRSPLRVMQSENVQAIAQTPKSAKRTSSHRHGLVSGSSSVRRSTRIMQRFDMENID